MKGAALALEGVGRTKGTTRALDGLGLTLAPGARLAVLGPSGAGKTTLLRLIAGLEAPDQGRLTLDGRAASEAGRVVIAPEDRGVALVFQGLALFPHLSVREQIAFFAGRAADPTAIARRLGLGDRLDARPDALSGGERQRLALARAFAQRPRLFLLDEPFSHLDPPLRRELEGELLALLDELEATLVVVTHAREDALALAREVLVLERGRALVHGAWDDVARAPRDPAVARILELGTVVEGDVKDATTATTPFGPLRAALDGRAGRVKLLLRPEQLRVAAEGAGVRVVRARRLGVAPARFAVEVEAGGARAVVIGDDAPAPGSEVRVALDGEAYVFP